jgi:hypothetical protein
MTSPLWTPIESRVSQTALHLFSSRLSSCTSKSLIGLKREHKFSVDDPATFWLALRDFTKISGEAHLLVGGNKMPSARFLPAPTQRHYDRSIPSD